VKSTDPFEFDDAAYLLGALSDPERTAFEIHLASCAACTGRVAALAGTAARLAGATAADLGEDDDTAERDALLSGLLERAASVRRRRRRRLVTGVCGVAAASVAVAVAIWPSAPAGNTSPQPQAMAPVAASSVHATAALTARKWGTEVTLDCYYTGGANGSALRRTLGLQVIDRSGATHELGTWTVTAGSETTFDSGTALVRAEISSVQITLPNGTPILRVTT
jgi:hypothetical protein